MEGSLLFASGHKIGRRPPKAEHGQEAGGDIAPSDGAVNRPVMQKTPGQAGKNIAGDVPQRLV
jgi:hypothetical protein